ncbi:hypothetical protein [Singulisphaera sp. PoT]|uniref:hypothetical protein n=1 Tax=Singulisphaera sp. PoT TaxID=3411797 RepID=UPI003BF57B16
MSDANPYEGPKSDRTASTLERRIATNLLRAREQGYTYRLWFGMSKKYYLVLLIYFGLSIAFFWSLDLDVAVAMMSGILFGHILRDFATLKGQFRTWPVQRDFIDWEKVRRAAEGE